MARRFFVLIAVVYALSDRGLTQSVVSDADVTAKADAYLNNLVLLDRFSGSVLVARDGKVLLRKGYGMANLEHDQPNTPQTKFRIASVTKQFTAAAVLLLQERGQLSVENLVCTHVPDCPATWRPITIHHLLSHTSGIPSYTALPDNLDFERRPMTVLATVERFKNKALDFEPGKQYYYSDSNFFLLGHIVERASGQSYEDFLRINIFRPLGMSDSGYDHPSDILKHRATGYAARNGSVKNVSYFWEMDTPFAAGALYSTVDDLYRWSQALDTAELLSRESLDLMFTPHAPHAYGAHGPINYAYGWMVANLFNRPLVFHDGGIGGFVSYIGRFANDRVTVIVLSNREDAFVRRASRDLSAITLGERYTTPTKPVSVDPVVLDAYVGEYQFEDNEILRVSRERENLMWMRRGATLMLVPQSDNEFLIAGGYLVTFVRDKSGQVSHLRTQDGRQAMKLRLK